jgi:hypothetical protein
MALLDVDRSNALASQIKAKGKKIFDNAAKAAAETPGAVYVQGFVAVNHKPFEPIEHAWIEVEGAILDPNFGFLELTDEAKASPEARIAAVLYFEAQQLTPKKLKLAIAEAKEDYPEDDPLPIYGPMPHEYYGHKMMGGKAYQEAFNAAESHCLIFRGEG